MGFFASRTYLASSDDVEHDVEPEWYARPRSMLAGYSPQRAVVLRTPDAALIVGRFDVYPAGVEFTIDLRLRDRDGDSADHIPCERVGRRRPGGAEGPDGLLRLGIAYADGSSWSNLEVRSVSTDTPPTGPLLTGRGQGGDVGWMMNYWLWPLPPPGLLGFLAEWPPVPHRRDPRHRGRQ